MACRGVGKRSEVCGVAGLRAAGFWNFDGTKPISRNWVWIVGVAGLAEGLAPDFGVRKPWARAIGCEMRLGLA